MHTLTPILLVEDDSVDAMTVRRAMRDLHVANPVVHSLNGEDAIKYLADPNTEKPFVILLDLNMPKMSGIEFLRIIKTNPNLKTVPVIVLTTSKEKRDVLECFELGAVGYMVKPVDYAKFTQIISTVVSYWYSSERPEQNYQTADAEHQSSISSQSR